MFSSILGVLNNIRLSITQFLLLAMAAIIAVLAAILRFKSAQLHAARVQLLEQHYDSVIQQQDHKVATATERYNAAIAAYHEAQSRNGGGGA